MNKKLKEKEIILILKNMSENIHEVFVITRLDKFFKIEV
jgi:anti-anti-sigma regulatory factor